MAQAKVVNEYKAVIAVHENLSFTQAAKQLGCSKSQVSKWVTAYERHIGKKLFDRTTRSVRPTTVAQSLVPTIHAALTTIEQAEFLASAVKVRLKKRSS